MPRYTSGAPRVIESTEPAPVLRALPDPISSRRDQLISLFKDHPRAQTLEEILSGEAEGSIEDDEAEQLATFVECALEAEPIDLKLWEAIQTCREAGIRIDSGESPPKAGAAKAGGESVFGNPRSLSYLLQYDTENDPNNVIGNRWICRGRSFIFVSQSGVGKSSFMAQLAIGWALNRADLTFGIAPIRPLRQLILQAENDDGDLAEPLRGIFEGFALSADEKRDGNNLVEWHEIVGISGEPFLDALEAELAARSARGEAVDVCWIDPLNNFIGGDISRIQDTKPFTERLDVIGRQLGTIFGIVHHTGKPPKDERESTPSDLAYSMLGSSGLTNWAREVLVLKREKVEEGEAPTFSLTATKRRTKAGMATLSRDGIGGSGIPTETIYVRHATDGSIRWEQCPCPGDDEGESGESRSGRGKSKARAKGGAGNGRRGRPSSLTDAQRLEIAEAVAANGGDPRIGTEALDKLARKLGKHPRSVRNYLDDVAKKAEEARAELAREGLIGGEDAARRSADKTADALLDS